MTHDNSYFDYLPDHELHPSSILPSLIGSGTAGVNKAGPNPSMFPSGYNSLTVPDNQVEGDIPKDAMLIGLGSGLFTGNFADFRQERHFVDVNGQLVAASAIDFGKPLENFEGEGINKYYPSPTYFSYGTISGVDGDLSTNIGPGMSGVFITYPPSGGPEWSTYNGSKGSGIFNFKDFVANLGHVVQSGQHYAASGFNTFNIFNDYIHYYDYKSQGLLTTERVDEDPIPGVPADDAEKPSTEIRVPFVADLIPTTNTWDRYQSLTEEDDGFTEFDPPYEDDDENAGDGD